MKIVFINDIVYQYALRVPSAVGGAERQQWLLARALAKAGWSVEVGVSEGMNVGTRTIADGVEFVGIGRGRGHILSAWYRFLASERPDWWYWRCASHLWGPAVELANLVGVRTIFALGFDREVELRHALFERPRWWPLYAWGLSRCDRIFAQHEGQLCKLPPRLRSKACVLPKVCVLPGTVGDTTVMKPHDERPKYIAWVAMLRQHKRPDVLVEIARRMPDVRFVVCGGTTKFMARPGYGERIVNELRALPNVDFRGQVRPEEAQEVIAGAAMLLLTSDVEGFPNTFVQAWSTGTPVVSLRVDPDSIIERVGLGKVSGNVEQAITDINALMASPYQRNEMGIRARRFIADNYSAETVVRLFERAVRSAH